METIDHGQVVLYDGDRRVETAKNGVKRIGTYSKFGFGEFRLCPVDPESAENGWDLAQAGGVHA